MTRLQSELDRLYPSVPAGADEAPVRALVLALRQPADWAELQPLWRGVQADLQLPAPAIAVSGTDAPQLWFSLAEPVPAPRARAFLEALRLRFLADVEPRRVQLLVGAGLPRV